MKVSPYFRDLLERFGKTLVQVATAAGVWVPASHSLHLATWQTDVAVVLTAGVLSLGTSAVSRAIGSPNDASALSSGRPADGPSTSDQDAFAAVWQQASTPEPVEPSTRLS